MVESLSLAPKIKFLTSDGEHVEEDKELMMRSITIKSIIDDGSADEIIPLPETSKFTLEKVIDFLKHLKEGNPPPEIEKPLRSNDLKEVTTEWYANFIDLEDDKV